MNTFILNHERKKESQRDHKPREDRSREGQPDSGANPQPYSSLYARRRDDEARYGNSLPSHANTAEQPNPRRLEAKKSTTHQPLNLDDATGSYRHVRHHLSRIISKMDAVERPGLERGNYQRVPGGEDTYKLGVEAAVTTPSYGKRVSSV